MNYNLSIQLPFYLCKLYDKAFVRHEVATQGSNACSRQFGAYYLLTIKMWKEHQTFASGKFPEFN